MRTLHVRAAACLAAFLFACPGGGTVPRSDIPLDAAGEGLDEGIGDALDGVLGEEAGDLPVPDDSGPAGDPAEVGPDTPDTALDVPRVPCTTDEECEAVLGEPRECLRVFCDLSAGECRAEVAPDGVSCVLQTVCEEDGLCAGGTCRGNPITCDDDNPCTDDACDPATGCVFTNNAAPCDDGNECTTDDACSEGRCAGTPVCGCQSDADCLPYEDGNLCNGTLRCEEATCVVDPATVIHCEPPVGKPCVVAQCVPATGACEEAPAPEGTACDDADICTMDDRCVNGGCTGSPIACDDQSPCTEDLCDPGMGCLFVPSNNGALCSDGNPCTSGDQCSGGMCAGVPKDCTDANPCTDDACDPATGECVHAVNTAPCDDGDGCTLGDACQGGQCAGTPRVCDDINSCTADSCDPAVGCVFTPANDGKTCGDGNLCTTGDVCAGGKCVGTPKVCNDGNPCTNDSCDKKTGACVFTPNTAPCDDANACTIGDACQGGQCTGTAVLCNDQNECTIDSCDPARGCVFTPVPNWPPVPCDGPWRFCWDGRCVGLPGGA